MAIFKFARNILQVSVKMIDYFNPKYDDQSIQKVNSFKYLNAEQERGYYS